MNTKRRFDGKGDSADFNLWIRDSKDLKSEDGFAMTDVDSAWHQFGTWKYVVLEDGTRTRWMDRSIQNLMLIEVKVKHKAYETFNKKSSQWETLRFIDGFCKGVWTKDHHDFEFPKIMTARDRNYQNTAVKYWGLHLLQLSHDNPENSKYIYWNESVISLNRFILLFQFKIHPLTFRDIVV